MKTNSCLMRNSLIVTVLVSASVSLYSQDRSLQDTIVEMSEHFGKEIGTLRDSIAYFQCENDRLHKELSKALTVVEAERDERKRLTKVNQRLEGELKEANGRMSEKLKPYDDKIKSQRRELASRDSLIVVYKDSVSYFHSVILRNETLLADLSGVRNPRVKELLVAEDSYMSVPYSRMDTSHISEVIAACEILKDSRTDSLASVLRQLLQKKQSFDCLTQSLESPYDSLSISINLANADSLYAKSSEAQKTEIDSVKTVVRLYDTSNKAFPIVISRIANFMSDYRGDVADDEMAYAGAESFLSGDFVKYNYAKYIAPIPYLVRRFDEYKSALLAHPKEKPELEKELNID